MTLSLKLGNLIAGIILGVSVWQFSENETMTIHTWIIHGLLDNAWVRTQASGREVKPWPWAKTWPLARLSVPHLRVQRIILSHADNSIPLFVLGHLESSVLPGELGNSVVSSFHGSDGLFLRKLREGDVMVLESSRNGQWQYRVSAIYIADKANTTLLEPSLNRRLTLISYYQATPQDNRRYVVVADELERISTSSP